MASRRLASRSSSGRTPAPSFPRTSATGAVGRCPPGRSPSLSVIHNAAPTRFAQARHSASVAETRGQPEERAHRAAEHLRVGQFRRPLEGDEPAAPRPSAVRAIVPTLPGSCTPSRTTTTSPARGVSRSSVQDGRLDHRDDALRMLGVGEPGERAIVHSASGTPAAASAALSAAPRGVASSAGETAACRMPTRAAAPPRPGGRLRRAPARGARARGAAKIPDQRLDTGHGHTPHGMMMQIALTIAGSDSGGGAGIQADLKTFHQFGVYGTSVIVALTAQNTRGVRSVHAVPAGMVQRPACRRGRGPAARRREDRHAGHRRARPPGGRRHPRVRLDPARRGSGDGGHLGRPAARTGRRGGDPGGAAAPRRRRHAEPRRGRHPRADRGERRGLDGGRRASDPRPGRRARCW